MISSSASLGDRRHAEALIAETEQAIRPLGITLSAEKTRVAHIDEGIDFLGWRIQRQPREQRSKVAIYTYPSKPVTPGREGEGQGRSPRPTTSQTLDQLIHRLNPVLRGWCDLLSPGGVARGRSTTCAPTPGSGS